MKSKAIFSGLLLLFLVASTGCVTNKKTNGYQTNPPVKSNANFPHDFSQSDSASKNGLQKFISNLTPKKKNNRANTGVSPNDATNLNNKPVLSPELLTVAGEMSLDKNALDTAEDYFTRAVKTEPKNIRANLGLARVAERKGNKKKSQAIYQSLRKWYPNTPLDKQLGNSRSPQFKPYSKTDTSQIIQASFLDDAPEKINDRSPKLTIAGASPAPVRIEDYQSAEIQYQKNERYQTVLQPNIEIHSRTEMRKVLNPFFSSKSENDTTPKPSVLEKSIAHQSNLEVLPKPAVVLQKPAVLDTGAQAFETAFFVGVQPAFAKDMNNETQNQIATMSPVVRSAPPQKIVSVVSKPETPPEILLNQPIKQFPSLKPISPEAIEELKQAYAKLSADSKITTSQSTGTSYEARPGSNQANNKQHSSRR